MKMRRLGSTALQVSEIGFGCGKLGSIMSRDGNSSAIRALRNAFDRGINLFDTADIYGQGRSEQIINEALGARRHSIVITTKAGYQISSSTQKASMLVPALRPILRRASWLRRTMRRRAVNQQDFSPGYLIRAIDASLVRLRTDYIDIFLLHSPDAETIERAEWIEALERAKEQGKIRCCGVSCRVADHARLCLRVPGIACVQMSVNRIEPNGIEDLLRKAREAGVGVLARQPLASGMLAKPVSELRAGDFPWIGADWERRWRIVRALPNAGATEADCVRAALDYVLKLHGISSVILGMSSEDHLRRNLQAIEGEFASKRLAGQS